MFIWRFVGFVPKSVTRTRAPLTAAVSKASLGMKDVESNMMMMVMAGENSEIHVNKGLVQTSYGIYIYVYGPSISSTYPEGAIVYSKLNETVHL